MKTLILLLSFYSITTAFAQDYSIEATWKVDSFAPINNEQLDEMDLLTIAALTMLDEDDKTTFLKIEANKISMLNAKQDVLKASDYYRIENEGIANETTIVIDEKPFLFTSLDKNHAQLKGGNVVYYLTK